MRILLGIVIGVVLLSFARPYLASFFTAEHKRLNGLPASGVTPGRYGLHLSPSEDLETIDIKYLRQAHETVDMAMFDFTDPIIANTLKQLAVGHVKIRVYRDPNQLRAEEARAARFHELSASTLLRGSVNIQIRVPQGSGFEAVHLAAWCVDRRLLRDGTAQWSAEEKGQDSELRLTTDSDEVAAFERSFESMWGRGSNRAIQ